MTTPAATCRASNRTTGAGCKLPRRSAIHYVSFHELIRVYPFDNIQQAADDAAAGEVVKPVLKMPPSS